MSQFGLFYEGVRWDIPSEGGAACLSYLSKTRRLFETLFFTFAYGTLLLWCIPRLKLPVDERYAPRKHVAWITMVHCLVFGIEIGYKLTARSLIFIFNPCHALTAVQIWLLFAKPSSFVTAVFRLHLHGINGTLLALLLPTTGTRTPALRVIYFVQHILILLIPACILDQKSAYSIEPLGDFTWGTNVFGHTNTLSLSVPPTAWNGQRMPPAVTTGDQFKLSNLPTDTVSAVHFQPGKGAQFLLASSWDCMVHLYDVTSGGQRSSYEHACPVLASCFADALHAVSGSLEGTVKYFDLNTSQVTNLGKCNRAVSVALYSQAIGAPLTGSWDKTVRVWDPRASNATSAGDASAGGAVSVHQQPDSVFTMDAVNTTLVVGTAGRHVLIWDLRNMAQPIEQQESTLRYQTRIIRCFPNGQGFVMGSIEGRVAVRMFDKSQESQKKSYVFKCHRKKEENREVIYPVTAISFHQRYNTFATGGSDGMVNTWDGFNRKWLAQFEKYPTTISSLDFCEDGTQLAIGVSYLYENGEIPNVPAPAIYIRSVADSEVRRKNMAPANAASGGATISAPPTVPPTRY